MAIDTVGPSKDYADFATREAAATGNDVEFYSGADLAVSTWNNSGDAGVEIRPATGEGTDHTLASTTVGYVDVTSGNAGMEIQISATLKGLRLNISGTLTGQTIGVSLTQDGDDQTVDGCLFVHTATPGSGGFCRLISTNTNGTTSKTGILLINNTFHAYGAGLEDFECVNWFSNNSARPITAEMSNNTGIYRGTATHPTEVECYVDQVSSSGVLNITEYNNIAIGFDVGAGTYHKCWSSHSGAATVNRTADTNMSSDTTAPGTTTYHSKTSAEFDDWTDSPALASGSAALNVGTDRSSAYTTDGIGTARPQGAGWDLGSIETIVASAVVVAQAVRNRWQGVRRSLNLRGC